MTREKKIARVMLLACFMLLCASWILWIPLQQVMDSGNHEKRELAARPTLTGENYKSFPKEYEAFVNDHMPFRNNLIQLNSMLDYFVFHKTSSDRVAVGSDNWLFYTDISDGNPIASYQGTDALGRGELLKIAQNCIAQRNFLREQGKELVIFIAPNKERVYSEYIPERYGAPAETYAAQQIYDFLSKNTDLRVVYPYAELMEAKAKLDQNIWYKTDTHWNYLGGYVGAAALLKELGIDMPVLYGGDVEIKTGEAVSGDLAGMLNLEGQLKHTDREYTVEGYALHDREELGWDFYGAIAYHATGADPRKLYVIRDSFSTHMAEYLGSQFNDSVLRHRASYAYADLAEQDPDVVVYETVERYVNTLATFSIGP